MMKYLQHLFFSFLLISLIFAGNQDLEKKDLIKVSGSDFVEVLPDTAYFKLNISIERDTPESAAREGEKVRNNIKAILQKKDIVSESILQDSTFMTERWDYKEKRPYARYNYSLKLKLTDFQMISDLRKTILSEKTFAPVQEDWFTRRKLSVQHSISYEVIEQKQKVIRMAFNKAYKNALEKVKEIAGISNLKYKIHRVEEVNDQPAAYRYDQSNTMMLRSAAVAETDNMSEDTTIPSTQRFESMVILEAEILD